MADKADKNAQSSEGKSGAFSPLFDELEGVVGDVFNFDALMGAEEKKEDLFSDKNDGAGDLFSQTDTLSGCLDAVLANTPEDVDISLDIPSVSSAEKPSGSGLLDSFLMGDKEKAGSELFDFDGAELTVVDEDDMSVKSSDLEVLDASMMVSVENEKPDTTTPNKILEAVRVAETSLGENLSSDRTLQCNVSALELLGQLSEDEADSKTETESASAASADEISAAVRQALGVKGDDASEDETHADNKDGHAAVPYEASLKKKGIVDDSANATMRVSLDSLVNATKHEDETEDETRVVDELKVLSDSVSAADKVSEETSEDKEDKKDDRDEKDVATRTSEEEEGKKADEASEMTTDVLACIEEGEEAAPVQLSERARMGQFYPTEEVRVAETEVKPRVDYEDALCEAVEDPDIHKEAVKRNVVRTIVSLAILCAITIVALIGYEMLTRQADAYVTAQKYGFVSQNIHWLAFASSQDGRWTAVCNNARGAVFREDKLVSTFYPHNGCQAIQITDNGNTVYYVGTNGYLSKFSLSNDMGFVENSVGVFDGLAGSVFSVNSASLTYVREDANGFSVVTHTAQNDNVEPLPSDAIVCFGSHGDRLAYLSGLEMNIVKPGLPAIKASLDDAKLACPREFAIACAYDGDDRWSVVCRNAYVMGRGSQVMARDQYHFESVFTGIDDVSIHRHAEGTEIVLPQKWISIKENAEVSEVELSRRLRMPMMFVKRDTELDPLVGIDAGKLATISRSGVVSEAPEADPRLVAAGFINENKKVLNVWNDQILDENDVMQGSYLVSWNLDTASLENQIEVNGRVLGVNISNSGRMGYVVTQKDGLKLTWINWDKFSKIGELELDEEIEDTIWSSDSQRVIMMLESGQTGIWEKRDHVMVNALPFSSDVSYAFHSNEIVWELNFANASDPRVRLLRLKDGQYGVDFEKIENVLRDRKVNHVTTNPYSRYVLFWGEAGIWRYDAQSDVVAQIVNEPVTWLSLSHGGALAATNLGIVDLATKDIRKTIYAKDSEPLLWSGDDKYLETSDGVTFYALDGRQNYTLNPRAIDSVRFIGEGAGINLNALRTVSVRDDVATIEDIGMGSTSVLAAISGYESESWCWMTPEGKAQGKDRVCQPLQKYELEQMAANVEPTNDAVLASTSLVSNVDSIVRNPVSVANFVDKVKLKVQAVPADAQVLFDVSGGDKPEELVPEGDSPFFDLPFETTLKTSDRGFAAAFYKPGYVMRTVQFNAKTAEKILKAVLLNEAYNDITVVRHGSDEALSEDTSIAIANFVGDNREALSACLEASDGTRFLMVEVNEKCRIEPSDEMSERECLDAAFENIVQPDSCDAALGLEDSAFERFDIVFP